MPYPLTNYTNAGAEWLTFEALFNHMIYRRSNQQRPMGSFRIPLQNVRIVVASGVPDPVLTALREAFFPELLTNAELLSLADQPWVPGYSRAATTATKQARGTNAVMPYNYSDNTDEASAIGTGPTTRHNKPGAGKAPLVRLTKVWTMWTTASRSCVVELTPSKLPAAPWPDDLTPLAGATFDWPFGVDGPAYPEVNTAAAGRLTMAALTDSHVSVKTGVMYVGLSPQGGTGGKATLEENSLLACLRSEYVTAMDNARGHQPANDPALVVLREILTVTENLDVPGDGFQVRDLSALRRDHVYVPALSIPYIGALATGAPDLTTMAPRWANRDTAAWTTFWRDNYAATLGRAKALLLLRYGLQLATPNGQNFLIELRGDLTPTGRLVLRDLGDASLHTEAIWAVHGTGGAPPAQLRNQVGLAQPLLAYECEQLPALGAYYPAETGNLHPNEPYPHGTQFHWHYYSSLGTGKAVFSASQVSTDPDARTPGWQRVLRVNAEWGLAHNQAYTRELERGLGLVFGINWATVPAPARYDLLAANDYDAADTEWRTDLAWERAAAVQIQAVLASPAGQQALRAYQARNWQPVRPVEFRVDAHTQWGQNIKVVGADPALGNWQPAGAVHLSAAHHPTWSATVPVSAGRLEYKYIRVNADGSVDWESGNNRIIDADPAAGPARRDEHWRS